VKRGGDPRRWIYLVVTTSEDSTDYDLFSTKKAAEAKVREVKRWAREQGDDALHAHIQPLPINT